MNLRRIAEPFIAAPPAGARRADAAEARAAALQATLDRALGSLGTGDTQSAD